MSLIGEALKKLSDEERPPHLGRPIPPEPRRPIWPWIVVAASLSLVIGALFAVWSLRPPTDPIPAQTEPEAATTLPTPSTDPIVATEPLTEGVGLDRDVSPPNAVPAPAVEVGSPARVEAPEALARAGAGVSAPVPDLASDRDEGGEVDTSADSAARAREPITESTEVRTETTTGVPPQEGRVHLERVVLPDGREIVLDGVAWSDESPAALLNGGIFSIGEGLDDWVITAIDRREVEIVWRGTRFRLRTR